MGDAYFVDTDYDAAVEAYTKSLATKEDATTYQRRAAAYLELKQNPKVCRGFSFIDSLVPCAMILALLPVNICVFKKALEDASRAIELEPSNPLAFYRKG